jgi:alkyl sulfatase BDS1-like metallo-beta-lactamase superfamily hydrolase
VPGIGSDAWIEAFAAAVRHIDAGPGEVRVLHRVVDGPAWLVATVDGHVCVERAEPDDGADVTFTWERDDAEAVARGHITALTPFQAGRLRVGGDLRRLVEVADRFARLPSPVR